MRTVLALLVAVSLGAGCSENCDCSGADPGSVIDVAFATVYGPATVSACFGSCNEAAHESGRLQSVSTEGFAEGWQDGRVAIEVIDADGRVLTAFSAEPDFVDGCCGGSWRIEEPAG
ncbi:MAG: hypothetical protein AAGE98_13630 [Actinomycetota bacterium]